MNITVPLVALILTSFVVGGGWTIAMSLNRSFLLFSSASFLFSVAVAIFSWDWIYPLGGEIEGVNLLILIISLLGWVCAGIKYKQRLNNFQAEKEKIKHSSGFLVLLALVVAFFVGLFPKMDTPTSLTMAFRTGPDAIGAAIASDALFRDGSESELTQKVLNDSSLDSVDDLFADLNVYRIPSFSRQVKAEFILSAAPKIGFTGVTANVMSLIGLQYLWSILALLPTISLLFCIFLIFDCLRSNNTPVFLSVFVAIGSAVNVNAIHLWHEGSIAQSFVYFPLATIFFLIFSPRESISKSQKIALSIASSIIIFSHTEVFILLIGLLLIFLVLILPKCNISSFKKNVAHLLLAILLGAIVCGPYFVNFIRNFSDRLNELGPGGWNMAVWPRLPEIFGLVNSHNAIYPFIGHTTTSQIFSDIFSIVIVVVLTIFVLKSKNRLPLLLTLAILSVFLLVLVKVLLIDRSTNYQYVKAIGALAPFLIPSLALSTSYERHKNLFNKFALTFLCTCIIVASTNYVLQYRQSSTRIAHDIPRVLSSLNQDQYLNQIDFLMRNGMEEWTFAPFIDLRLINRRIGGVDQILPEHKKIGLILKESECNKWACVQNTPKSNVIEVNSQYRILLFDTNSKLLYANNGKLRFDYISIINRLSLDIQGPVFDKDFKIK